jgi:peptidoglycan hydrolase CwlO-like protein
VAIEDRLNKVDSNLRMLKAKLKTKEEQLRASRKISKSIMTVEKELRIKIEKAKEELSAKEKQAAARRTKKNSIRDNWAKKQMADYDQGEAKQQAQAKKDSGVETASAGAAMAASYEDFDIDVYGD